MSGAPARRQAVRELIGAGMTEAAACRFAAISRSSYRYLPRRCDETELIEAIKEIRTRKRRWGYKRVWARLRRDGYAVNESASSVSGANRASHGRGAGRRRSAAPARRCRWPPVMPTTSSTYDFIFDAVAGGRRLKVLTVLDEYTRLALAIVPGRSLTSATVKGVLAKLFARHGKPWVIRSNNGPEFVAFELTEWVADLGAETYHIEPGKPWKNSFGESFHARLRHECLSCDEFWSLEHARVLLEDWRCEHNTEHLHSPLRYATPAEFAAAQDRTPALVPA